MLAGIVPLSILMSPNHQEPNYSMPKSKTQDKGNSKENIFEIIYEVVRAVPKGRVTSYGAVAAAIGARSGARMVGYAMNACTGIKPKVPAHRVVNRNGMLSGKHHFNPPELMQQLLEKEGIKVKDDQVVDFQKLFWDPAKELAI
jgi:methylated-DNA-protein-cysteine methyltransferase-like protein